MSSILETGIETSSTDEVFDVGNWLERANIRLTAPDYQPRHRADVPTDFVASV